jgi:dihydroorotate dehydrogenase (fumarate)
MHADLSTTYLGLELRNPIVASAGPLTGDLDSLKRLEQAGVAAVVLPSLFEEQLLHKELQVHALYEYQANAVAESLSYFPELDDYNVGPNEYLEMLEAAKRALSVPVIASLNGSSPGAWARFAKLLQNSGADAIELNIYFVPSSPRMMADSVEARYADVVAEVRQAVTLPLAVKIGAQFSNLCNFAWRLSRAGADGLVLFNRYLEPDIDLETLQITPQLALSSRHELRLPLRWIAILRDQVSMSLAATSGIHMPEDVVKLLLVGADVCMLTSALLRHGIDHAATLVEGVQRWLDEHEYDCVEQLKGSMSYRNCPDPGQLERANYMKAIASYTAVH